MKKILLLTVFVFCLYPLFAEDADLVYVEGYVDLREKTGDIYEALIGDLVQTGDTIITGEDGFAEMEKGDNSRIIVSQDTIFTFMEIEKNGHRQDVFSCALGSISFKFKKFAGKEPGICSPSMIAGVRGTEFTVFTGDDGSSLIAVESGLVAVESEGETVELNPEEGVEVMPGEPPGEKFKVLRGKIDYSKWSRERFEDFLNDPVTSVTRVQKRLESFHKNINELMPLYEENMIKLENLRTKLKEIREKEGTDASKIFREKYIAPIAVEASNQYLNVRYYALSSLSLRRYILGRMYVTMKSRYITNMENEAYREFIDIYDKTLTSFENISVVHLVDADI